jgi:hypothetical protein
MAFLYGDSTPSPLESNFLEFLRDALDFSVIVLHADANIEAIRRRKHASARSAEEEVERLQAFGRVVTAAIQDAPKGDADSETSRCAAQLSIASSDAVSASTDAVNRTLAEEIAQAEADEAAQREASFKALEALLLPHAPTDARLTTSVERQIDGSYTVSLRGESATGLAWRFELTLPEGHVLQSIAPLDRLEPQLEFQAPEQTGWLKKEVKPRPQRLERYVLAESSDDGTQIVLKLLASGGEQGFDFIVTPTSSDVVATRKGKEGDLAFDLSDEDAPKIVSLAEKLRGALAELKEGRLVEATFDSGDFRAHPVFKEVVERLVSQMAPTVQEIARHSLTQTELVIRRLLSNERREEIFVTKSTLREKYAALPREQRSMFDAFGFDTLPPPPPMPSVSEGPPVDGPAIAPQLEPPPLRSEVAKSQPPPPPAWLAPPSWPPGSTPRWRRRPPSGSSSSSSS